MCSCIILTHPLFNLLTLLELNVILDVVRICLFKSMSSVILLEFKELGEALLGVVELL